MSRLRSAKALSNSGGGGVPAALMTVVSPRAVINVTIACPMRASIISVLLVAAIGTSLNAQLH